MRRLFDDGALSTLWNLSDAKRTGRHGSLNVKFCAEDLTSLLDNMYIVSSCSVIIRKRFVLSLKVLFGSWLIKH